MRGGCGSSDGRGPHYETPDMHSIGLPMMHSDGMALWEIAYSCRGPSHDMQCDKVQIQSGLKAYR
jgi:hypothetical protein